MTEETAYLTAAKAAAYLDVTRDKIYELCRQGQIPSTKFGHRTLRIPKDGFLEAIRKLGLEREGEAWS